MKVQIKTLLKNVSQWNSKVLNANHNTCISSMFMILMNDDVLVFFLFSNFNVVFKYKNNQVKK